MTCDLHEFDFPCEYRFICTAPLQRRMEDQEDVESKNQRRAPPTRGIRRVIPALFSESILKGEKRCVPVFNGRIVLLAWSSTCTCRRSCG